MKERKISLFFLINICFCLLISNSFATEDKLKQMNNIDTKIDFSLYVFAKEQIELKATTKVNKGTNVIDAISELIIMSVKDTDWGPMIISLANVEAKANKYWSLWVNGNMSNAGARDIIINSKTEIKLILEEF